MKWFVLVLKNLRRNQRRSTLTVLSITVSLFIFCPQASVPVVGNQTLADSASFLRIACHNKAGLAYELPQAYKQEIEGIPHVVAVVSRAGSAASTMKSKTSFRIWPEQIDAMSPDWESPGKLRSSSGSCSLPAWSDR